MARVLDAIVSHRARRLSCVEAGELLGLSERHFRRLRDAYEDHGRGACRPPARTGQFGSGSGRGGGVVGGDVSDAVFRFHGQALPRAGGATADGGRQAFPSLLQLREERVQLRGLTTKAPRRGVHRRKRERRPLPGMMLFQDGSQHAWLRQGPKLDLDRDAGGSDQRDHFDFSICGGGARPRAFASCRGRSSLMVCSRRSTPTGAATTSSRRRRARRSTRRF